MDRREPERPHRPACAAPEGAGVGAAVAGGPGWPPARDLWVRMSTLVRGVCHVRPSRGLQPAPRASPGHYHNRGRHPQGRLRPKSILLHPRCPHFARSGDRTADAAERKSCAVMPSRSMARAASAITSASSGSPSAICSANDDCSPIRGPSQWRTLRRLMHGALCPRWGLFGSLRRMLAAPIVPGRTRFIMLRRLDGIGTHRRCIPQPQLYCLVREDGSQL